MSGAAVSPRAQLMAVSSVLAQAGRYWVYDKTAPHHVRECVESEENAEWLLIDSQRVVEFGPGRVREALEDTGMFDPDDHRNDDATLTAKLERVLLGEP